MNLFIQWKANRPDPITQSEGIWVNRILERYEKECPFSDSRLELGIQAADPFSASFEIMGGKILLPVREKPEEVFDIALYWLDCLTELRKTIPTAQWSANAFGIELIWETETGWRFPEDDELPD
ncbi:MAG: hypothetical protein ACOX60_02725 [Massiliimalia sp.]|jgi:hypothetical protein